jgi:MFS family permease
VELSPASSYRAARRVGVVGWLACASSYYAFFCYAQAAALVFPSVYFPSGVTEVGLIASLATFGVGYVARPVGSIVIGKWADTHGWVDALFRCLLIMGLITLLIGVLPGYDSWGLLAPTLLVLLRIGQGFVMGGLLSCASVLAVELAERNRRGYRAGLVLQGVQAGQLLAAAVFLPLVAAVSLGSFQDWGWRIPFALGVVPVCVAFFVRYRVQESPAFLTVASRGATSSTPLRLAARENLADLVRVAGMALMNVIPTVATVFGAPTARPGLTASR